MKIVFIRHGWTNLNEKGILCGFIDDELSEKGKKELTEMVKRFPYPEVQKVYCSPMKRCLQTAAIVYPGHVPYVMPELHEMDFGAYDGHSSIEARRELKKLSGGNILLDNDMGFPGGESIKDVRRRMVKVMRRIIEESINRDSIAIVGHSAAFSQLFEVCMRKAQNISDVFCPNGMGILVCADPDEFLEHQKMDYVMGLPENAERPDMSNSPYISSV